MKSTKRKIFRFRPSVAESSLEQRLVLTGGAGSTTAAVLVMTPPTNVAAPGVTPAPAASPLTPAEAARALARVTTPLTVAKVHGLYKQQVRAATSDLKAAIETQLGQLYANGATPTAQQIAAFDAGIAGSLDATALRLSTQAALLPHAGNRLVPAIQKAILGSGSNSLVSRLSTMVQSGQLSGTTGASSRALTRLLNTTNRQGISQVNTYFNATPVSRLSVDATGQRIPLEQYMGTQLLNQVGNTLGSLAQSFPSVANAILYPNGTTTAPTQAAISAFNTQVNNALGTVAYQLGSGLAVFPNSSNVIPQIQPLIFGAANNSLTSAATGTTIGSAATGTTIGSAATGTTIGSAGSTFSSLAAALQNLQYGGTGFDTAVSNAFGNAYQSLATPLGQFLGLTGSSNLTLPTSGLTSPFGSAYSGSSFYNGFNNGFATGTTPGFIGFGSAPTGFNSSFGTGFNDFVTTYNTNDGFMPGTTGMLPGGDIVGSNGLQGGELIL